MSKSWFLAAAVLGAAAVSATATLAAPNRATATASAKSQVGRDGIIKVRSAYGLAETITRLKADVAAKGIMFFSEIDQAGLAAGASVTLKPSTLLVFGNPPLGTLFISANPLAGLDWPVRLLVYEDANGHVWAAYTDFGWIARRHRITSRAAQFKMATGVIASIISAIAAR